MTKTDEEIRKHHRQTLMVMAVLLLELEPPDRPWAWAHITEGFALVGETSHVARYAKARAEGKSDTEARTLAKGKEGP